jgi:peroxiredoxin Q/BCP
MRRAIGLLSGAAFAIMALAMPPRVTASADELKVGDPAPDFSLPGSDGKTYSLSQLKGKYVVLAWFPKAFTAG